MISHSDWLTEVASDLAAQNPKAFGTVAKENQTAKKKAGAALRRKDKEDAKKESSSEYEDVTTSEDDDDESNDGKASGRPPPRKRATVNVAGKRRGKKLRGSQWQVTAAGNALRQELLQKLREEREEMAKPGAKAVVETMSTKSVAEIVWQVRQESITIRYLRENK